MTVGTTCCIANGGCVCADQLGNTTWSAAATVMRKLGKRVGCYSAADSGGDFGIVSSRPVLFWILCRAP